MHFCGLILEEYIRGRGRHWSERNRDLNPGAKLGRVEIVLSQVRSHNIFFFFFYCHDSPVCVLICLLSDMGVNHQFHQDTMHNWFVGQRYDICWYHSTTLNSGTIQGIVIDMRWHDDICLFKGDIFCSFSGSYFYFGLTLMLRKHISFLLSV